MRRGVAVQDPREAPYAAAYAESIGADEAAAANRELAQALGLEVPVAAPAAHYTTLNRVLRTLLFPAVVVLALVFTALHNDSDADPPRPQPLRPHPSLKEAGRGWWLLADYKCFQAARALGPLSPLQRLELKVQTAEDIGDNDPPAAAIVALIHLERSLRAEGRGERRTAHREAQTAIRIFASHGAPSCARAFG